MKELILFLVIAYAIWVFVDDDRKKGKGGVSKDSPDYMWSREHAMEVLEQIRAPGGAWSENNIYNRILRDHPPRKDYRDGDLVVLNVRFVTGGHTYCYRAGENIYKPGDRVVVYANGVPQTVTVASVGYYSDEEYPFKRVALSWVEGLAKEEKKEERTLP